VLVTDILRKLESQGESSYIYTVISYVAEAAEFSRKDELFNAIKQLESINEDKIMTLVEMLKPDIYNRGKAEVAFSMLKKGISVETVAEVTALSSTQIEALKKQIH